MSIVKLGYVELAVEDLDRSKAFYVDTLGFIETARSDDALYLRGVNDFDHHCLVLRQGAVVPQWNEIGWRVDSEAAIDQLQARFQGDGLPVQAFPEGKEPGLGRCIRLIDSLGQPVAFYHRMEQVETYARKSHLWRGAAPRRLDHVATTTADVKAAQAYYEGFGFHTSEYAETQDGEDVFLAFMHVTSHDHDIAFVKKAPASLQHVSFWMGNVHDVVRVADVVADAGYKDAIEFGPGRHKATNSFFVYLFDPDGNRVEFYTDGTWIPDRDLPPVRWTFDQYIAEGRLAWGDKAPESFRSKLIPGKSSL